MPRNPFDIPDQLPEWLPMGDAQQSDTANQLAPSLDLLKLKVGQMRNKPQGGAGSAAAGAMGGGSGGMKPESL